jgi:hypothetical protein
MTPQASNTWSDSLQQKTREAIEQIPATRDGNIHFKHPTLGYAFATPDDLMNATLMLRSKTSGDAHRFVDVDALLAAGWAAD